MGDVREELKVVDHVLVLLRGHFFKLSQFGLENLEVGVELGAVLISLPLDFVLQVREGHLLFILV
jgi:hypothetical protein